MVQIVNISHLRKNLSKFVEEVATQDKHVVVVRDSNPEAVLVDVEYFQALEEAVLDATDAQEAQRAKKEERVSLEGYVKDRWGSVDA